MFLPLLQVVAAVPTINPLISVGAPVLSMAGTVIGWLLLTRKQARDSAAAEGRREAEFARLDKDVSELKYEQARREDDVKGQLKELISLVQAMREDIVRLKERDNLAKELSNIRHGLTR